MAREGLDFSRMNVQATRESLKNGGGVVYKDEYYNTEATKYKKTKKSRKVSSAVKAVLVLAMECKRDYEGVLQLLAARGLGTVKESYWDMAKRVGSYGEEALKSWVMKSNPITYYKENFS
jgi:hypothetical protein